MVKTKKVNAMVHKIPEDLQKAINTNTKIKKIWENDITPLAKNEWICWVISAKKLETRERRIKIALSKLSSGEKRPCCWAGCPHC